DSSVNVQLTIDNTTLTTATAMMLPALFKLRQAADRAKGSNNLRQLGLAMHHYHDQKGHFPPAVVTSPDGKPLYSCRVELLPYLEQEALYNEFHKDEPWDSPHNLKLLAKMPPVFALAGAPNQEPNTTFFQVFVGPTAPFRDKMPPRLASFTDGASNTL